MSKTEKLNKLFDEWQDNFDFDIFCRDGIIDEENYGDGIPEVVFLLKDANLDSKEEADIRENLLKAAEGRAPLGQMWKVLCMWIKLMSKPDTRFAECLIDGEIDDSIAEYLSKVAVVNLSKEHGTGRNDQGVLYEKLTASVRDYYEYTQKEIDIIAPELVVCCGTYHYIKEAHNVCDKSLPSGARYFVHCGRIYLEMCHPGRLLMGYKELFAYFREVYSDFDL
ncbi:MAG: hypothetical protein IKU84_04370 [Clostridia bacterium]|nr:hypothetical protein [Clostridia bacterium]